MGLIGVQGSNHDPIVNEPHETNILVTVVVNSLRNIGPLFCLNPPLLVCLDWSRDATAAAAKATTVTQYLSVPHHDPPERILFAPPRSGSSAWLLRVTCSAAMAHFPIPNRGSV